MQHHHSRLHLMTKPIQIANHDMNAQNLTFIKTQSIVNILLFLLSHSNNS